MSVFASGSERPGGTSSGHSSKEGNLSIVAAGMRIVGELTTNGVVKIEGVVEGCIRAEQEVLVAKEGLVEGDIFSRQAVIGGKVVGSVQADERVEVQPGSVVNGNIATKRLIVQEGGEVNGEVNMGSPAVVKHGEGDLQLAAKA